MKGLQSLREAIGVQLLRQLHESAAGGIAVKKDLVAGAQGLGRVLDLIDSQNVAGLASIQP